MKALEVKNISKNFGGLKVLKNVSFSVEAGERRAIIGPNAAGKTTLFNVISGILKPDTGNIEFFGKNITGLKPFQRARLGIARTFQKNNLFSSLSVMENLKLAMGRHKAKVKPDELLENFGLQERKLSRICELSYGEQRQVEILLALAQSPKLILLDEPTAGMSPVETEAICRIIGSLPRDIAILMIEHDLEVVFNLADRVTVLHLGEVICEDDRVKIRDNVRVREAYLGKTDEEDGDNAEA